MIKKTIQKIGRAKTFVVLLAGLDTGFSVINGLLTHRTAIGNNTDVARPKPPYPEIAPVPARPVLVKTLPPQIQMTAEPISERPLRKRSG